MIHSDQKRLETEEAGLPESRAAFWRKALDSLPLGLAQVDARSAETLWVNDALQAMLESAIRCGDVIGRRPEDYLPNLNKEAWRAGIDLLEQLPPGQPLPRQRLQFVDQSTRNIAYWEWTLQRLDVLGSSSCLMLTVLGVSDIVINERLLATSSRTADRARRRAEALVKMTQIVNASLKTPDLLRAVTREAAEHFGSPHAAVLLLLPDQQHFAVGHSIGLQPVVGEMASSMRSRLLSGDLTTASRAVQVIAPGSQGVWTPLLDNGLPPAMLITSPIAQEKRIYGLVEIYFANQADVSSEALSLLTAYADQAAVALSKSDLYEEIEQQRRQLQSIVDNAPVGIVYFGPDGTAMNANAAAARRYGHPISEIVGSRYDAFMTEIPVRLFEQVREGAPFHASHFVQRLPDGSEAVSDLSLLPVRDGEGRVAGLLLLDFDVTDLVTARQEADGARQEAENALAEVRAAQFQMVQMEKMRALGELSSGVAHDFNNALMAILGYTELAEEDLDDTRALASHLAIIRKAAQDASSTVQRLQRFARQSVVAHGAPTDLNSVVQDVIEMTRPRWRDAAQKEGRAYEIGSDLRPLPLVIAEPSGLREVLVNIVYNALNAMPNGGKLTLATRQTSPLEVEIKVTDTGVGMTPEVAGRIFDPFFTTRGVEGTGLGLAVSWTIIQRHGGTIVVDSAPGQGSCFSIRLPVGDMAKAPAPASAPASPIVTRQIRALVVEDEPIVASVLSSILRRNGFSVTVVHSANDALEQLRRDLQQCQIVLTDHGMPGMNGLQLVAEIKRMRPELPVMLLTGWGETVLQTHVAEALPDAVLAKPINQSDLLAALHAVLASHAASNGDEP